MEKQQEMVKMLWIDENGKGTLEEVPKQIAEEAMLYSQRLDEMPEEEQREVADTLDNYRTEDLECKSK